MKKNRALETGVLVLLGATWMLLASGSAAQAPSRSKSRAPTPDSASVLAILEGMRNATCPLPGVAIGGQPDSAQLLRLGKAGFRTVLDLRTPEETRGFDEPGAARAAGLSYLLLPIGRQGVPDSTFDAFRAVMTNSASHPVLVHCASGNRVGPVVIAWLVLDRGWSLDRAVEIAQYGGLRSPSLEAAVRDYIGRRRR